MNIYEDLNVTPVLHAAGTKTTHGGTKLSKEVLKAMESASEFFVSVEELNKAIGKYIAFITGAEAGMVTSGAASGVVLSIAACMTGTDRFKIARLPNSAGMKNELIIQKFHVGSYSHMYTFTGAKFVEIGTINGCEGYELDAAINENTAAVAFLFGPRIPSIGLSLKDVVRIAHSKNIPVIVDAAAILPPKINLTKLIEEGADLVTISGGKIIHGPQNSGILYGKKELIEAAFLNASPNHAIGRPHKVSKETMIGLYAALKKYADSDEELFFANCRKKLEIALEILSPVKEITSELIHDWKNYNVPVVIIKFIENWHGPRGNEFTKLMLQNKPRIFMQYFQELDHLVINPVSLTDKEIVVVSNEIIKAVKAHVDIKK